VLYKRGKQWGKWSFSGREVYKYRYSVPYTSVYTLYILIATSSNKSCRGSVLVNNAIECRAFTSD